MCQERLKNFEIARNLNYNLIDKSAGLKVREAKLCFSRLCVSLIVNKYVIKIK